MQYAIGCEYLHIDVEGGQLSIQYTAWVHRELCDKFISTRNMEPPWSMNAFVGTVSEIEYHDVVSSGIFADEFRDNGPQEWTKQALKTLEEATESYMVEVIAESSF